MIRRPAFWLLLVGLTLAGMDRSGNARPPAANTDDPLQAPDALLRLQHDDSIYSVTFSPDGKTLAGTIDKRIRLWEAATGKEIRTLVGHHLGVHSVAFSPDGKLLASGSCDKEIRLWDTGTGKESRTLSAHQECVRCVAFSPDGKTLASASDDQTIRLWEPVTGKEIRTLAGSRVAVEAVAFSPEGKTLASASGVTTRLWDVSTGQELRKWTRATLAPGDTPPLVHSVAFSPDGKTLASGVGSFIRVWDVATGKEIITLKGHQGLVVINSIAFSPDSKTLASGSGPSSFMDSGEEKCIRLWDVTTGKEIYAWGGHPDGVYSLGFSPDGKSLGSGGEKGVLIWRTPAAKQRDK